MGVGHNGGFSLTLLCSCGCSKGSGRVNQSKNLISPTGAMACRMVLLLAACTCAARGDGLHWALPLAARPVLALGR